MPIYYGRFKQGRKWSETWHRVPAISKAEALGKLLKGTRYSAAQVQITTKKPA
jgi:hypothetical protein